MRNYYLTTYISLIYNNLVNVFQCDEHVAMVFRGYNQLQTGIVLLMHIIMYKENIFLHLFTNI